MNNYLLTFSAAFAICALLTPFAIKAAPTIGFMDVPKDQRRMHKAPIPRLGGAAIFAGLLISILVFAPKSRPLTGSLVGAAMMFAVGLIDDRFGMSAKVKFVLQIVCASVPCFYGLRITGMGNLFQAGDNPGAPILFPLWVQVILTVFWIVGITNTVNLIDGLDGLAAGISGIAGLAIAYTAYLTGRSETCYAALAVAGAAFGFLIFNFYPAKIFMGDCGSMLLGYMLSTVSLLSDSPTKRTLLFTAVIPVMVLIVPVFDTTFAIVRRAANHKPIMQADKGHFHHRIMAMGFGQRRTVLALYCITAVTSVAGILWTNHFNLCAAALLLVAACLIFIFLGIGMRGEPAIVGSAAKEAGEREAAEGADEQEEAPESPGAEEAACEKHLEEEQK